MVNTEGLPRDLWEHFTQLGNRAEKYARDVLEKDARDLGVLYEARRFQDAVRDVVNAVGPLSAELHTVSGTRAESVSDEIGKVLMALLEELQRAFPSPDQAPHHEARKAQVEELYMKAEDAIVRVLVGRGLSEARTRMHLERLRPHVVNLIVITGKSRSAEWAGLCCAKLCYRRSGRAAPHPSWGSTGRGSYHATS